MGSRQITRTMYKGCVLADKMVKDVLVEKDALMLLVSSKGK